MASQVYIEYLFTLHTNEENFQLRHTWLGYTEPLEADMGKHHQDNHFENMLTAGLFVTACVAILVLSVAIVLSWGVA